MAHVAASRTTTTAIDWSLAYLFDAWETLPALADDEWPEWDRDQQRDFLTDWPIKNSHLALLRQWHAEGQMTAAQEARFADLQTLIARNHSTLDAMGAALSP